MADGGKAGKGCVYYGCVTIVFVTILGVASLYFFSKYALKKYFVEPYTSTNAVAVAPVRLPAAEGEAAIKRAEDFRQRVISGTNSEPLTLTSEELDYVVRMSADGKEVKDRAALAITNNQIRAEVSIPMDAFQVGMLKGRYLNGIANFTLGLTNGGVVVNLQSLDVNGQQMPAKALEQMAAKGITWFPNPNDQAAAVVTNLGNIEIKDNKLYLHPRPKN